MRIALVIIFCFASIFSQSDTSEEDILEDTLIPSESTEFDTNTEIEPEQTFQIIIQKKIEFYREISIGNTWLLYDTLKPEYFLHYTYRIGFGISGGVVVNLKKPFRLRAGLRIYQSGNKLNVSGDFYRVNYDSVTNEPIDSLLVHQKGYFKLAQYLISMPVTIDIFLKNIP